MEDYYWENKILTIYRELGFTDRYHYFETLSSKFNIPIMDIIFKAEELGIENDFTELLDWIKKQQNGII